MELTVMQAFTIGRVLELARSGEDDVAIFILDRDWPEGLVELQKLATEIGVPFDDNADYIIERLCNDELGLSTGDEENTGDESDESNEDEDGEEVEKPSEPVAT